MPTLLALDRVLTRKTADVFGRYQLLGRLGAGGMAEVFVARCGELAGMQSLLAVKRILPHLADDEGFVALFRREAQISLRLRHRAIARVVEVGRVGASWFLAMELVAGESLSHLLRAEKEQGAVVDPRLVAWVGAEIASALHHAHALTDGASALEVIHRDVSPQNLLLGFDGAAKLIDFGVARCARLSDATRTGTVRGKLAYASPEQLGARPIDGRSDLFSLAIVLHEWLAGAPLFARDSDAATVQAVQTAAIPPLARAPALGAVLTRALERRPERRYPDGESLAEALLEAAGGRPASPERLVAAHLAALFPERKRRWQAITAGRDGEVSSLEMAKPSHGDTVRGTPISSHASSSPAARALSRSSDAATSLSAAASSLLSSASASASASGESSRSSSRAGTGTLARRRTRRRWALAFAAGAGLASLLVNWVRHDHGLAFRSVAPALSQAGAVAAAIDTTPSPTLATLPPPVAGAPIAVVPSLAPAPAPSGLPHPRVERPAHAPPHANRADRRRRAPVASPAGEEGPPLPSAAASSSASSGARRALVDELEPSPYATPR